MTDREKDKLEDDIRGGVKGNGGYLTLQGVIA